MGTIDGRRGFILVDVLVAAVIIAVALTAMGGLLRQALRANAAARCETAALALAQDKLEQLKAAGFAAVPKAAGPPELLDERGNTYTHQASGTLFTRTTDVRRVVGDSRTVAVAVTVAWRSPGAAAPAGSIRLATYYIQAFGKEF